MFVWQCPTQWAWTCCCACQHAVSRLSDLRRLEQHHRVAQLQYSVMRPIQQDGKDALLLGSAGVPVGGSRRNTLANKARGLEKSIVFESPWTPTKCQGWSCRSALATPSCCRLPRRWLSATGLSAANAPQIWVQSCRLVLDRHSSASFHRRTPSPPVSDTHTQIWCF